MSTPIDSIALFTSQQAVVARLLVNPESMSYLFEKVSAEDFSDETCGVIYDAIFELYSMGDLVDAFSVANYLMASNRYPEEGLIALQNLTAIGKRLEAQSSPMGLYTSIFSVFEAPLKTITAARILDESVARSKARIAAQALAGR